MILRLKHFLILFCLVAFSNVALAQSDLTYRNSSGTSYIHGAAGFGVGGIALGGDYENMLESNVGFGGMGRFYTGEDKRTGGARVLFLGGFIRPHWPQGAWDFYVTPGVGLAFVKLRGDSETLISPTIGFGVSYAFSQATALGVETQTLYGITSDDFAGPYENDIMFKLRFRFGD